MKKEGGCPLFSFIAGNFACQLPSITMKSYTWCCLLFFIYTLPAAAQQKAARPAVKITGEVITPLTVYADSLSQWPRATVTLNDRDNKAHSYTGIPLQAIFEKAGVTTGKQLRGENLTKFVLVKCADGYEVVFSLAELDSSFTNRQVILAAEADGHTLSAEKGPFRLVVPGEKKPARSCFQVTDIIIQFAKE
jgi:DMSO/TMAO reductase YedYZ molybdopterin-dependent catalytic subunit